MCNLIISNPCKFMFFFSYRFSVNNPFLYFYFFIFFFLGGGGDFNNKPTEFKILECWQTATCYQHFVPQYLGNSSLPSPQSVFPSHRDPGGAQVPSSHLCWPWGQSRVVVPIYSETVSYNITLLKSCYFNLKSNFH